MAFRINVLGPDDTKRKAQAGFSEWKRHKEKGEAQPEPPKTHNPRIKPKAAKKAETQPKESKSQKSNPPGISEAQKELNEGLLSALAREDLRKAVSALKNGADANADDMGAAICHCPNPVMLEVLLEYGANPNAGGGYPGTPMMAFIGKVKDDDALVGMLRLLIESGADVNAAHDGETALMKAMAKNCHLELARLLIKHGAKVDARDRDGKTALMRLFESRREGVAKTAKFLIGKGADVNAETLAKDTPLIHACVSSDTETIALLIEQGANVNAQSISGASPLLFASYRGNVNAVRALVENGADVNHADNDGKTPLISAARSLSVETGRILLEAGADILKKDHTGKTALHHACLNFGDRGARTVDMVLLLLEMKADANAADNDGTTPLMNAAKYSAVFAMEKLIEAGADVNLKDREGVSALRFAIREGNAEAMELLRKNGAKK